MHRALEQIRRTSLGEVPAVAVSGRTGQGLDALRAALVDLVGGLDEPDPAADVRIWVDRAFHVRGAGTVATGTLPAGTVRVGDTLAVGDSLVRVRALECLGRPVDAATGVSRVAVNVGGKAPAALARGAPLVTPDAWPAVDTLDVRLAAPGHLPSRPLLHVGATAVSAHVRPLDEHLVRLVLERPLPLRIGDRALLRDPGSRQVWGVVVVDPAPPDLRRRGAAGRRAKDLAGADGTLADEVARRGLVHRSLLRRIGVDPDAVPEGVLEIGDWLVSPERSADLRERMAGVVRSRETALEPGVPVGAVARDLGLPSADLVSALVQPPLRVADGRVFSGRSAGVPARLLQALETLRADLAQAPYAAPDAARLTELGLDQRSLAALAKAGHLLRIADTVVLLPGADTDAADRLAALPQPFTTSEARKALGTTRRVALPLLAHLDRRGLTTRLPDDRRQVRAT
jgi:selenocysteine-specific elongation factor